MLKNRFVSGINDTDLGKWVHMQHPRTLDDAVEIARSYESFQKVNGRGTSKPCNDNAITVVQSSDDLMGYDQVNTVNASTSSPKVATGETNKLLGQILEKFEKLGAELKSDMETLKEQVQTNTKSLKILDSRMTKVEKTLKQINKSHVLMQQMLTI